MLSNTIHLIFPADGKKGKTIVFSGRLFYREWQPLINESGFSLAIN
jgi:hypothetical protein